VHRALGDLQPDHQTTIRYQVCDIDEPPTQRALGRDCDHVVLDAAEPDRCWSDARGWVLVPMLAPVVDQLLRCESSKDLGRRAAKSRLAADDLRDPLVAHAEDLGDGLHR